MTVEMDEAQGSGRKTPMMGRWLLSEASPVHSGVSHRKSSIRRLHRLDLFRDPPSVLS